MDDLRAVPEGTLQLGEHLREDVGADDQHPVGVADQLLAVRAEHVARLAAPQRVRGGDVHLGGVDLVDVGAQQLGDGGELALRPGERHPVPDQHDRPLGGGQQLGRPARRRRRGGHVRERDRGRQHGLGVELVQHVHRQCDEHGPARRGERDLHGPPHGAQDGSRIGDAGRVLGHGPGHRHQVGRHLRVHGVVAHPGVACDDDERGVAAQRLVEHPDAVAQAHSGVQLEQGRAAGRPGVPVGDTGGHGLLEGQYVPEVLRRVDRVEESLFHRPRISEHHIQAVGLELLDQPFPSGSGFHEFPLDHPISQWFPVSGFRDYQPYRVSPSSRTSTIFCPVR